MDPIAHTLFGAGLAEAGFKRRSRLATPTLIIGANLPDIDGIASALGRDASLWWRRGWTHGVLALVVLPVLLTLFMRWYARRRPRDGPPFKPRQILLLAYIGVLSHSLLDWMNTYGVRLLMPFDGRWFYGDAFFIVEPWMWLLAGAAVVLARSGSRMSVAAWILLGTATSALVLGFAEVPLPAKAVWIAGVAAIVGVRLRGGRRDAPRLAIAGLTVLAAYGVAMLGGTHWARAEAAEALRGRGVVVDRIMTGPVPANPLRRDGVVVGDGAYRRFTMNLLGGDLTVTAAGRTGFADKHAAVIKAAMAAPAVRGFANWARFPYAVVESDGDGWAVTIRDLRYAGMDTPNPMFTVMVRLDSALNPR